MSLYSEVVELAMVRDDEFSSPDIAAMLPNVKRSVIQDYLQLAVDQGSLVKCGKKRMPGTNFHVNIYRRCDPEVSYSGLLTRHLQPLLSGARA